MTFEEQFRETVGRWVNTAEGRWALEEERRIRSASLFSSDPLEMARRVGALEVVEYLLSFGGDAQ